MELLDFSANTLTLLTLIAVVFPFLSFLLIVFGKRAVTSTGSIFNIGISFISSLLIFLAVWNTDGVHEQVEWFSVGGTVFTAGIFLNNLSVLMMALVSGIALLVHVYSISYMKGDVNIHKYSAYRVCSVSR